MTEHPGRTTNTKCQPEVWPGNCEMPCSQLEFGNIPSGGTRAHRDYREEMTYKWSLALNKWKSALTLRQLNTEARKHSPHSPIAVDDEGVQGKLPFETIIGGY